MTDVKRVKSLFLSDVHLGARGCQADLILDFLKHYEAETIYLVGDIIDIWRMKKGVYWPQSHNDVVQKLLRKSRKGTRMIYLPGNHDEGARQFLNMNFGDIEIVNETTHVSKDGKRYLVIHGDKYDGVVRHHKWLAHLGESSYNMMFFVNRWVNLVRRKLGLSYWSLAAFCKRAVKQACTFISNYEETAQADARQRNFDGIICGHIHQAKIDTDGDIHYLNAGDWVENCTALTETLSGEFKIVNWPAIQALSLDPAQRIGEAEAPQRKLRLRPSA